MQVTRASSLEYTSQRKNGKKIWIDSFSRKMCRWPTSTWNNAQHPWLFEKYKSKIIWDTTSHQSEWPSLIYLQITNAGMYVEKREPFCTVGRNVSWYHHYGDQSGGTLEIYTSIHHMTQQSHSRAYIQTKHFKKTHAPTCSLQHCSFTIAK